jgi:dihydrodipicolinate synthase/N-acetylneuraminate lyase
MNLRGVIPVLCTPFTTSEAIDEAVLRNEVDFTIRSGAVAICAPAFGSEVYKLSDAERYRMAEVVLEQVAGRVPVVVGTSSGSVHGTLESSRHAESIGAALIMVAPPRTVALGHEELTRFYEVVCNSVKIPVMLRDADFTGGGLPATLLADLAQRCSNFLFAKLENPMAGGKCRDTITLTGRRVEVLYGWGGLNLLDGLAHGAGGVMPGPSLTDLYVRTLQLYHAGQAEAARSLFHRFMPFLVFGLQHLELFIHMEKCVLARRGVLPSSRMREPTLRLDQEYQVQIDDLVDLVVALAADVNER